MKLNGIPPVPSGFGTGTGDLKAFISCDHSVFRRPDDATFGWKVLRITDANNQSFPDDDPLEAEIKGDIQFYFTQQILNPYDPKRGF